MPPAPRSCRGGISCRPKRPPRNGKRHETEGRMRCGHYRGGVAEGEGQKNAPASGATSWRLRAWLRPGHFFFCHSCESRNPGSLCSCRGGISCRPKRPPRNGKRHETEGRMRCGHYRGGVAEGEGKKRASFWRHRMAPAGGAAPRSFLVLSFLRKQESRVVVQL